MSFRVVSSKFILFILPTRSKLMILCGSHMSYINLKRNLNVKGLYIILYTILYFIITYIIFNYNILRRETALIQLIIKKVNSKICHSFSTTYSSLCCLTLSSKKHTELISVIVDLTRTVHTAIFVMFYSFNNTY